MGQLIEDGVSATRTENNDIELKKQIISDNIKRV